MSDLRVRVDAALEHLSALYTDRPWHLVAFVPEGAPNQATRDWIATMNGQGRNLYYQVNPLRAGTDGFRASLKTIDSVHYLHVDLDPREGENVDDARTRILAQLKTPPDTIPRPSVVVASGSGVNALWRLDSPI